MQKPYDIVGIGAALVDSLVPCSDDFLQAQGLEKGRMHLIDAGRAAALQAEHNGGAQRVSGGSAANTCLGVASFGGKAGFMGGVGNDALSRLFADDLAQAGMTFTNIAPPQADVATGQEAGHVAEHGTGHGTGFCTCFITPDGERTMATYLGASGRFDPMADAEAQARATRLLYIEGYIWDTEARVAVADRAIRAAKAAGGEVALTVSDAWCAEAYRDRFLGYCRQGLVDILFANEAEIVALTQAQDFDSAIAAASELVPVGVFTRGAEGAVIQSHNGLTQVAAIPVAAVTDATGAGDLFAAGFIYGYLTGLGHAEAGSLGARAAAEAISHLGARPQIKLSTLKEAAR